MGNHLELVQNPHCGKERPPLMDRFTREIAGEVGRFHRSFPEYRATPLADLSCTGALLGGGSIYVKDESSRFGLGAFKVLGGSYCLGRYLEQVPAGSQLTFVTATDGNHGRGIAWAAARLGFRAVVYLPAGSSAERLENIRSLGAEASITPWNYDDTVRYARSQAEENGWVLVQDTAWPGYEEIPTHIMQGYLTMGLEAVEQLGDRRPTHIFLQAGVGAMSGALTALFRNIYGFGPKILLVEPDQADCLYRTARADDGQLHCVAGSLDTIMAGLACGEPCTLGWELLRYGADAFLSMGDSAAAAGMRILGNPVPGDDRVISGESGAAGFGALCELLRHHPLLREKLGLNEQSVSLCFSAEGATDTERYRSIVWDGSFQSE